MKLSRKHILVIRLSSMGDVAMTAPVIQALTKQNSNIKVTVLTRPFFAPFFKDIQGVSVFCSDFKNHHKGFLGLLKLYNELINLKIDFVVDLHNVLRSKVLIALFRFNGYTCHQIDKARKDKKKLTSKDPNKKLKPLKTTHERYADVFRKLGYTIDLSESYPISKKMIPELISKKVKEKKLIGIAPFAAYESKSLPISKLHELIKSLSTTDNISILLFGGGDEQKDIFESITKDYKNTFSCVGKVSFKEELDVISNLNVMISVDSGNGHIAALYDVPVITIWGVTHPFLGFTPYKQPDCNQIIPDLKKFPLIPTSVYGKDYPKTYLNCFETIQISEVSHRVREYL
ncbi:glycosyltransferase family 9 protein [Tenacibaculum sp. C7A-26P2]|uniref:glycosyltransferase family 9 protein n=1 Tax=Tenacibaculum sp. C7A-26P2 TaxID=3447504 RepID=UPI003F82563F